MEATMRAYGQACEQRSMKTPLATFAPQFTILTYLKFVWSKLFGYNGCNIGFFMQFYSKIIILSNRIFGNL